MKVMLSSLNMVGYNVNSCERIIPLSRAWPLVDDPLFTRLTTHQGKMMSTRATTRTSISITSLSRNALHGLDQFSSPSQFTARNPCVDARPVLQ